MDNILSNAIRSIKELVDGQAKPKPVVETYFGVPHQSVNGAEFKPIPFNILGRPTITSLEVHTLAAVIDYLKGNRDEIDLKRVVVDVDDRAAIIRSSLRDDGRRDVYLFAKPKLGDEISPNLGRFLGQQQLMIWLQTCFEPSEDRAYLLRLAGNLVAENVRTVVDDGVSQEVVVKGGTVRAGGEIVKTEVLLVPHRTFPEVTLEPERFLVRLQGGSDKELPTIALFAAAGDAWRLDAISKIKAYLVKASGDAAPWAVIA